eukprot:11082203-Lingulodinium_polyedra.AAC.1
MVHGALLEGRKAYDISQLVHAVLAAAHLRASDRLKLVLCHGIHLMTNDPTLRQHLEAVLNACHRVPGRSALIEHRLTVHMAWC